jgi:citrate lyase subunit beta / citryl-CoA lyase
VSYADPALHRSYLYAPGSAPAVMRKALEAGSDAVVLDLEDAVAADAKAMARAEVAAVLAERAGARCAGGGDRGARKPSFRPDVHVRINRAGDRYLDADLDAVVRPGLDAIRLPKAESPAAIVAVAARLDRLERERDLTPGRIRLYPTVESALGAVSIAALLTATPRVVRAAIGTADLLADLGAVGDDELATLHVRSELVLQSRAAGVGPPIDSVHTDLNDEVGLRAGAEHARALGFHGKSVIHPRQLEVVHDVFTPTDEEVARARRIVATMATASREGRGAVKIDGAFIDAAIVARARAVLSLRSER